MLAESSLADDIIPLGFPFQREAKALKNAMGVAQFPSLKARLKDVSSRCFKHCWILFTSQLGNAQLNQEHSQMHLWPVSSSCPPTVNPSIQSWGQSIAILTFGQVFLTHSCCGIQVLLQMPSFVEVDSAHWETVCQLERDVRLG